MREPTRIYIAEDELLIATSLKQQLEQAGYMICGSSIRGEKTIEELHQLKLQNQEPEIVLMDIHLRGEMDGIATARKITEQFDCGIIFLTGQSSKEVYERSFFIKPFGYILKPYDLEQTIMTIEIAAYQRKLEIENRQYRNRLETKLTEKIEENMEAMDLYKSLVENSLVGISILQENQFVFVNQAFADMLGFPIEETSKFTVRDHLGLVHPEDREKILMITNQRLSGEIPPQHTTFRVFRKDGRIMWLRTFVKFIHYKGKPALHHSYLDVTDMHTLKKQAEALQKQIEDLQKQPN
ncbi:MAG: PAS domain S-box protein [bacterium]